MKYLLSSAILFFCTHSAGLMAEGYSSDICIGCEEGSFKKVPNMFLYTRINQLNQILCNYEYEGIEYQLDFNYHVGYIRGQIKAYQEVNNISSNQDSNIP